MNKQGQSYLLGATSRLAAVLILTLTAALYMEAASACKITNWTGAPTGAPVAKDPLNGGKRYSGQCGLEASAAAANFVSHTASNEAKFFVRFYVFLNGLTGAGNVTIFRAVGANLDARITRTGTQNSLALVSNNAAMATPVVLTPGWHAIAIDWTKSGAVALRVDGVAKVTGLTGGAGAMTAGQLGSVQRTGVSGNLYFDAYVANRTTAVAPELLLAGDADNNNAVNVNDILAIADEINIDKLATGQPDCNGSGGIDVNDILCVADKNQ